MEDVLLIAALLILFFLLGKSADLVVSNAKIIGEKLGIKIYFIGLMLGMLTSLPELAVGLNAIANDVSDIALGNLLGGMVVLLSLVLGLSIVLNRQVKTDGKTASLWPVLAYLFLPLPLALNGKIGFFEGLALACLYLGLLYYLLIANRPKKDVGIAMTRQKTILKEGFLILAALTAVVVLSNLIIRTAQVLIKDLNLSAFMIGLIVFAIGTNLPEIIITIRAWKRNVRELAFSNILGSSMANVFIIGIFAMISALKISVDGSFIFLSAFSFILFACVLNFYSTQRRFTRREGIILLCLYALFLIAPLAL